MDSTEIIRYWESKYCSDGVAESNFDLEPFLHGFLSAFSPGHSYHYILNVKSLKLQFVSPSVKDFSGVDSSVITMEEILSTADPDQVGSIKLKEQVIYDFYINFLNRDQVRNYKMVYLYKLRDPEGKTKIMLHQALILNTDKEGNLENVLSVHTDITYLGIHPSDAVSFFSLNGGPSYINLNTSSGKFNKPVVEDTGFLDTLTPREKEVITYLAKGYSSKEIASRLNLSVHTVQKHRKNILQKTDCSNTSELVGNCIMAGLLV